MSQLGVNRSRIEVSMLRFILAANLIVALPDCAAAETLATLGNSQVSQTDVKRKVSLLHAYGNDSSSSETALAALVNDALLNEVVTIKGQAGTQDEIAKFDKHAN